MKLQKEWYDKAKEAGFKDIEKGDYPIVYHATKLTFESSYNDGVNCGRESIGIKKHTARYQDSVREYYREATKFLHSHRFYNEVNKRIWELHVQGYSQKSIASMVTERTWKQSRYIAECIRDVMLKRVKGKRKRAIRKYT